MAVGSYSEFVVYNFLWIKQAVANSFGRIRISQQLGNNPVVPCVTGVIFLSGLSLRGGGQQQKTRH